MAANLPATRSWLAEVGRHYRCCAFGLSGGKDSLAIADLLVPHFERIECYALHLIPGLEFFEEPVRRAALRFGRLHRKLHPDAPADQYDEDGESLRVHRIQHPMGANMVAQGVFRHPVREAVTGSAFIPQVTMNDVFSLVRKRVADRFSTIFAPSTSEVVDSQAARCLIATGERMHDSLQRRGQLHKHAACDYTHRAGPDCQLANCTVEHAASQPPSQPSFQPVDGWHGSLTEKERRVFPIWDWSTRDVISYLRARKIPVPEGTGKVNMSGADLRLGTLLWMKENHPDDYDRVLEVFPHAEAQLKRAEFARNKP